jgi:hypothetical protein
MLLKGFVFDMLRDCDLVRRRARSCQKTFTWRLFIYFHIFSTQDPSVEARLMRKLQSLQESDTSRPGTTQLSAQKYLSI